MTRSVYVTRLDEIKRIKVICKKCQTDWSVPLPAEVRLGKCIVCGAAIPDKEIWNLGLKITELLTLSKHGNFEIVIETEIEKDR